jgi:hypothetical protein
MTASKNAGSTTLRRRSRRELRDPDAEVRDRLAAPIETGLVASSITAWFRDNAVPSVCADHLPLAIKNARKGIHLLATWQETGFTGYSVTLITVS